MPNEFILRVPNEVLEDFVKKGVPVLQQFGIDVVPGRRNQPSQVEPPGDHRAPIEATLEELLMTTRRRPLDEEMSACYQQLFIDTFTGQFPDAILHVSQIPRFKNVVMSLFQRGTEGRKYLRPSDQQHNPLSEESIESMIRMYGLADGNRQLLSAISKHLRCSISIAHRYVEDGRRVLRNNPLNGLNPDNLIRMRAFR